MVRNPGWKIDAWKVNCKRSTPRRSTLLNGQLAVGLLFWQVEPHNVNFWNVGTSMSGTLLQAWGLGLGLGLGIGLGVRV